MVYWQTAGRQLAEYFDCPHVRHWRHGRVGVFDHWSLILESHNSIKYLLRCQLHLINARSLVSLCVV
jgi:hypothetical protein